MSYFAQGDSSSRHEPVRIVRHWRRRWPFGDYVQANRRAPRLRGRALEIASTSITSAAQCVAPALGLARETYGRAQPTGERCAAEVRPPTRLRPGAGPVRAT